MDTRKIMARMTELLLLSDTAYAEIAKQNGLTYNALMVMYMMDGGAQTTQKDVCDALHLSKSTVHSIIQDLTKRGFVALTVGRNQKEKIIAPTEQGARLLAKILGQTARIEDTALHAFTEEEMRSFLFMAEKLSAGLVSATKKEYRSGGDLDEA